MNADEILPTIVELSVAVAGFSGIVAALAPSRPSQWSFYAQTLFYALLISTAASASISLLAMVLLASPLSSKTTWSTASAVHAGLLLIIVTYRIRQARIAGREFPAFAASAFAVMFGIAAAQLINALHFQAAWVCVGGLALYAAMGFVYFILLVTSLWEIVPVAPPDDHTDVE